MKERPILFSAPMVRAILDGRKTQTRRIMKPQPHPEFLKRGLVAAVSQWPTQDGVRFFMADGCSELVACPYGNGRLWVKETFCHYETPEGEKCFAFRADNWTECPSADGKWKPSIFMPRCASRITLEITAVRVERLQEISDADAKAEGSHRKIWITSSFASGAMNATSEYGTFRDGYKDIWEEINGPDSWAANPYVWVIEFKRKDAR